MTWHRMTRFPPEQVSNSFSQFLNQEFSQTDGSCSKYIYLYYTSWQNNSGSLECGYTEPANAICEIMFPVSKMRGAALANPPTGSDSRHGKRPPVQSTNPRPFVPRQRTRLYHKEYHVETLVIDQLDFNHNYYTFAFKLLIIFFCVVNSIDPIL